MGSSFLRNFYTIWDEEQDRLGFVTHVTSTATILTTTGVEPTQTLSSSSDTFEGPGLDGDMAIDIVLNLFLTSLIFNAILGPFLVSFGTVFLGDFTAPARATVARFFGINSSGSKSKKAKPQARMSLMHSMFGEHEEETVMDMSI